LTIRHVNSVMSRWYKNNIPLVGKKCYECYHNKNSPCDPCPTLRALKTGRTEQEIVPGLTGTSIEWIELFSYPIRDRQSGKISGVVEFVRDITEKKRLESQLIQAQKMEAIGTLAGGIAHDFNNILMGIQGHTSLMLVDTDHSSPNYESLKGIEKFVKNAANLTRQLLGFARGGKYEVRPANPNELVATSAELFGRTHKKIHMNLTCQDTVWAVAVDQQQIEQVLLNLYLNASQAMEGRGDITIETRNVTLKGTHPKQPHCAPGNYVRISIHDTGKGMDKRTQERIFEPFFTTKEMGRGTGLGLASVYGIINNHGGMINVHSRKGTGSTFNVFLPVSKDTVSPEKKSPSDPLIGSETILLVDDEQLVLDIGRRMLTRIGYNILTAPDGREAIQVFEKNRDQISLVILDVIMPGMSGGETFDRLRSLKPDVKVLLASGYSIDGEAEKIMERGCNGFIQKPFDLKQLSQKIRNILARE